MAASLDLRHEGPIATGVLLWRLLGTLHVSVIVKATLSLVHESTAAFATPAPLRTADEVREGSLWAASEHVPQRARTDVTLVGHACAAAGTPQTSTKVRLALFNEKPLLDRTIHVYGDRSRTEPAPRPFARVPLVFERAYGGPAVAGNPVGIGAAENDRAAPLPNLIDPEDPLRPAAFGPIPGHWHERRRFLGDLDPDRLSAAIVEVPAPRVLPYFQSAPAPQQLAYLAGDEWVVLDGVHPTLRRVQTRLPGARAVAEVRIRGVARQLHPVLDTLAVDADGLTASLVWRAYFPVLEGEAALGEMQILASLGRTAPPRTSVVAERASPRLDGTKALGAEEQARLSSQKAAPFRPGSAAAPPPATPAAERPGSALTRTSALSEEAQQSLIAARSTPFAKAGAPSQPPSPPPPRPSPPRASPPSPPPPRPLEGAPKAAVPALPTLDRTVAPAEILAALPRAPKSVLPFVEKGPSQPAPPAPQGPPRAAAPPRTESLTGTAALTEEDLAALASLAPLPFVPPDVVPAAAAAPQKAPSPSPRAAEKKPFRRRSPLVPLVTDKPVAMATVAWQVRPPRDSLTVIVKASFDLVPGCTATLRAEADALCGDVHVDDELQKSLLSASDFAIFKPKADVTVRGSAYPAKAGAAVGQVAFRFGKGSRRIERTLHVFGERTWKTTVLGSVATEPLPFERLPLRYENAFGGPEHEANPAGTGHPSSARGGSVRLPGLEDPKRPIRAAGDRPEPACLGPIAPAWKPRSGALGTYDKRWRRERWPYYPKDFGYAHFQHAPASQQVDYLTGDETFQISGVRPETATLEGALPGLAARAFAEKIEDRGAAFFEVPLHLDTVTIDTDALRIHLLWRGLLEVSEEEAPEINVLFATLDVAAKTMSLEEARARMTRALAPAPEAPPAAAKAPEPAPANDNAPPSPEESANDEEIRKIEAEGEAREKKILDELRAAGIPVDEDAVAKPPPAVDSEAMAARLRDAGAAPEDVAELLEALRQPPAEVPVSVPVEPAVRGRAEALLAANEPMDGADFAGGDLSGLDFSGRSLRGARFKDARLRLCCLAGAHLEEASLAGADLTGADLGGAHLKGADLTSAILEEAHLEGADLERADLTRARAARAVLKAAHGKGCLFANGDLRAALLDGARLPGLDLSACELDDASFVGAHLPGIKLYDARGQRTRFDRSTMSGARADGVSFGKASFQGVDAAGSEWEGAALAGCSFHGAVLTEAGLSRIDGRGALFSAADLAGARLRRAKLEGAQFLKTNLFRATLEGADLSAADLRGANLHGAETWKAKLEGARLDAAIVTRSKLAEKST